MRILICSLEAPLPPPNGLRVQVSALVRELRNEHDVRVLAHRSADQVAPGETEWMQLVPTGRGRLLGPLQEQLERFRPDLVHVTSGRLARLGRHLSDRPAVLAALDAWHLNVAAEARPSSWIGASMRKAREWLVKRFERAEYGRFARVVVVSEEDRRALLGIAPGLRIEVIPNGVDADGFAWDGTPRDRSLMLFTGVMSYAPNVTAAEFLAREVLPRVQASLPSARLALVGREPAPPVRALAERSGVEVVGEVPDLRPWLSRAKAYACPMLTGTGMKNKLLEAMANGLPCVATPLALQGLRVMDGEHLLVGSSADELAGHLVSVFGDEEKARRLGDAGLAYVRTHHTWKSVACDYERVYREVAAKARSNRPGERS